MKTIIVKAMVGFGFGIKIPVYAKFEADSVDEITEEMIRAEAIKKLQMGNIEKKETNDGGIDFEISEHLFIQKTK